MRRVLLFAAVLCVLGALAMGMVTLSGGFTDTFWRSSSAQWVQEPVYMVGGAMTVGLLCAALLLAGLAEVLARLEGARQPRRTHGPGTRVLYRERPAPPQPTRAAPPQPAAEMPAASLPARAGLDVMTVQRAR